MTTQSYLTFGKFIRVLATVPGNLGVKMTLLLTTPAVDSLQLSNSSDISTTSISNIIVQQSPFSTPPKLRPIEEALGDHPGSNLRNLALSLVREAIFGKEKMIKCSLSGRKNTTSLDEKNSIILKL